MATVRVSSRQEDYSEAVLEQVLNYQILLLPLHFCQCEQFHCMCFLPLFALRTLMMWQTYLLLMNNFSQTQSLNPKAECCTRSQQLPK